MLLSIHASALPGVLDRMKKKLILAGVFLGGLILVLIYIEGGFHHKVPPGRTLITAEKESPPKTIKVETTRTTSTVTVSATVAAREMARIAARTQGYVVEIAVDAGDTVKKGQTLVRIDNREMAEREAQAKAALESARAELIKAEKDYQRYKVLFETQSIAKKEFDDATARYETAKAGEQRASAALDEARTVLSFGTVTAPFDGVIASRDVSLGDLVNPGTQLFTAYMPGTLELVAPVGEQYAPYLKEGNSVTVKVPSISLDQRSTVREVVPQRDVRTRTITVKVPLKETPGLNPGIYGTLTFDTETSEVILIPRKAVRIVGQLETVRVFEDGAVKIRHVKAGPTTDHSVEILSGLSPGDQLVVE